MGTSVGGTVSLAAVFVPPTPPATITTTTIKKSNTTSATAAPSLLKAGTKSKKSGSTDDGFIGSGLGMAVEAGGLGGIGFVLLLVIVVIVKKKKAVAAAAASKGDNGEDFENHNDTYEHSAFPHDDKALLGGADNTDADVEPTPEKTVGCGDFLQEHHRGDAKSQHQPPLELHEVHVIAEEPLTFDALDSMTVRDGSVRSKAPTVDGSHEGPPESPQADESQAAAENILNLDWTSKPSVVLYGEADNHDPDVLLASKEARSFPDAAKKHALAASRVSEEGPAVELNVSPGIPVSAPPPVAESGFCACCRGPSPPEQTVIND